jgi:hypothetical protein
MYRLLYIHTNLPAFSKEDKLINQAILFAALYRVLYTVTSNVDVNLEPNLKVGKND